jgi:glutathione S-transferase
MLKVWGRRSSFNLQKVMWLIGELELPHQHINAGGAFGGLDAPAFLAMNPHGRVPVIADGDAVVWESHTILRYLAAKHSGGRFWSEDPAARARVEGWMDWSQTSLQPDFLNGVFWDFIEHRRKSGTGRRSRPRWRVARTISENSTGCSKAKPFCLAIRCRLPTSPRAPRCTAISSWRSSGRSSLRSSAGIAR